MNISNIISLSRIFLLFLIVLFLSISSKGFVTIAFIFFVVSAFTDWLDGFLARKLNIVSNYGIFIDAIVDKILILGVLISFLAFNLIPRWFIFLILLILTREFLISGLRLVAISKNKILASERGGKIKTFMQFLSISFIFLSLVLNKDFGFVDNNFYTYTYDTGIILFIFATLLTLYSGINYLIKYWYLFEKE